MRKIILASNSPRRRELMSLLGIPFEIEVSNYDEEKEKFESARKMVEVLSLKKAETVGNNHKDAVIIGADTTVLLGREIIGKARDRKHAFEIIKKLSGKTHKIITGFTILDTKTGKKVTSSVESELRFSPLTNSEIEAYLETEEYKDKAGAYAIQGTAGLFVEEIHGDFFNIVGLPMQRVRQELKNFGVQTLDLE